MAVTGIMARVRQVTTSRSTLADLEEAVRQDLLTIGRAAVQDGRNTLSAAEVRRHDVTGPELRDALRTSVLSPRQDGVR